MKRIMHLVLTALLISGMASTLPVMAAAAPEKLDILKLPEWQVTSSSYGGKLLLSDSPELVTSDAILYQDKVEGDARLFFHHVNSMSTPKRLVVLLENDGPAPAKVSIYQYGLGGPGLDWMAVGKAAQTNYLAGGGMYEVEIPAHGAEPLYSALGNAEIQPNMLVNGIFDFKADRPVTVKVVMMSTDGDIRKFARQAPIAPPDQYQLRGTFEGKDRMLVPLKVYDPAEHGAVVLTLADNYMDQYVEGIDATTGAKVVNYGNYGIVYKIFLPSDGQGKIAYFLNPRGGDYAGAMGIKYEHLNGKPVPTPTGRTTFGSNKLTDFAHLGRFGAGDSLWLTFSPPGASNLPVKLVILPE